MVDHPDFSVVVKRGAPPNSWRWEIYRTGRNSPIESANKSFETLAAASRAGKGALDLLLSEYYD